MHTSRITHKTAKTLHSPGECISESIKDANYNKYLLAPHKSLSNQTTGKKELFVEKWLVYPGVGCEFLWFEMDCNLTGCSLNRVRPMDNIHPNL